VSEDSRSALLRDVQALRDTLEHLQPEDLTDADKTELRVLLRELQAVLQLAQ